VIVNIEKYLSSVIDGFLLTFACWDVLFGVGVGVRFWQR